MLHRRDALLALGQVGLGALTLPRLLAGQRQMAANPSPARARAKSCIFIFLWGGPPHQDLWDLKPNAVSAIRGPFRPIASAVPGIEVCDQLPLFARHTDKMALVRSMTHGSNDHEISIYHSLTGHVDPSVAVPNHARRRSHFPGVGGVVTRFAAAGALPASVTLPGPVSFSGVSFAGTHAGFLGPGCDPFEWHSVPRNDLKLPDGLALEHGSPETRIDARRRILKALDAGPKRSEAVAAVRSFEGDRERALSLLSAPAARRALDLEQESVRVRDRFGHNIYGESFLMARRLIEAGVRLASVHWMHFLPQGGTINPWDNHGGSSFFPGLSGFDILREPCCGPALDRAYSALLDDLQQRGLLDETLVVLTGEFGRTPRINRYSGRDHWGSCYTTILAGGGVRGGQVYGSSDKDAAYPQSNPVAPEDILATIYQALGIPLTGEIQDTLGRPFPVCAGRPLTALLRV
jgi:hypothetical protein